MTLLGLIVLLVIVGVVLYLVNRMIPMDARVKTILNVVVILVVCVWVLSELGVLGTLNRPVRIH